MKKLFLSVLLAMCAGTGFAASAVPEPIMDALNTSAQKLEKNFDSNSINSYVSVRELPDGSVCFEAAFPDYESATKAEKLGIFTRGDNGGLLYVGFDVHILMPYHRLDMMERYRQFDGDGASLQSKLAERGIAAKVTGGSAPMAPGSNVYTNALYVHVADEAMKTKVASLDVFDAFSGAHPRYFGWPVVFTYK